MSVDLTSSLVSGGEAFAPSRAAALQDRAARARRHPRSKPVSPLAAADIRLVGAFHDSRVSEGRGEGGARKYRRRPPTRSFPQSRGSGLLPKSLLRQVRRCLLREQLFRFPHLWIVVWEHRKPLQNSVVFVHRNGHDEALSRGENAAMLATSLQPNTLEDGWITRRNRPPKASGTRSPAT